MLFFVSTTVTTALDMLASNHLSAWGKQIDAPPPAVLQTKGLPNILDSVNEMRAKGCADRPDPRKHDDCMDFMDEYCRPGGSDGAEGKRAQMNGEPGEKSTGKGYCEKFFNDEEKQKHQEEVKIRVKPKAKIEKLEDEVKEVKKHEPEKAALDLPNQGLQGTPTHHDNSTEIANWTREYGPKGVSHDFEKICYEHPENAWCQLKGYSGAYIAILSPLIALLIF